MNTNSLKRFATSARKMLMRGVKNRLLTVGFNEDGTVREAPVAVDGGTLFGGKVITDPHFADRWNALRRRIEQNSVKEVVEEAAYTWFNRLMAIRILTKNGLAKPVLDYENPAVRLPRIVTDARAGKIPFEQFAILIRAYCENNPILSKCFGGINDYTALLLPADILGEGNFIDLLNAVDAGSKFVLEGKEYKDLNNIISEEDFRKAELIGWLYQFYISDKKDEVMGKKGGYESDEIPAATQIFTPNWIVKYMVENTIGRIYLDNNPDSSLRENWKYLVEPAEPTPEDAILRYDSLEDLACGDLSCGSGHILNEMFDLLSQLYEDEFYSPREAVEAIFRKNLVGIDIDERARQLATFALLLKACQVDTAFADSHCMPRVYSMPSVDRYTWSELRGHFIVAYRLDSLNAEATQQIEDAFAQLEDAKVLGSIMKFEIGEEVRKFMLSAVEAYEKEPLYADRFAPLIDGFRLILALTEKYAALCMNPPYMPTNKEPDLKAFAAKNYPDSKADLFAVFMDVANDRLREKGKYGMINMQSWMFLSSFDKLRKNLLENYQIDSLLHLGPRTFDELSGEVVQNAAFVISKEKPNHGGVYYRLIDGKNCNAKKEMFLKGENRYVVVDQKQFEKIPGARLGYWVSPKIIQMFESLPKSESIIKLREGIHTGKNELFIRQWPEINFKLFSNKCCSFEEVDSAFRYVPYNKGGSPRKWFGNNDLVIRCDNQSREEMASLSGHVRPSQSLYFKEGVTWSALSSGQFAIRYYPIGHLFDSKGQVGVGDKWLEILCQFNSSLYQSIANILMPTLDYKCGDVKYLPYTEVPYDALKIAQTNINLSKQDWDAHETSWDFQNNPLIEAQHLCNGNVSDLDALSEEDREEVGNNFPTNYHLLSDCYDAYRNKWERMFFQLHSNEEEINRQFIEIYGLQDELTPDVPLNEVTILQQGEIKIDNDRLLWQRDVIIKQFISYAIGCMMGRYRLDRPGLAIAHPNATPEEIAPYTVPQTGEEWWIDDDAIVPMMGRESGFHDDAANRLDKFVEIVFGKESKTENMNFIREALGKDVEDYLRTDFYQDHKKMYQNRPIYWMFSSNQKGKRAAFQCLVYMHRMDRFTPEHIRTNYLLPYIETLVAREADLSAQTSLTAKKNKELKQLRADIEECRDYQMRLHEFADRQIALDLDDGVVRNYATFAPVLAKLK